MAGASSSTRKRVKEIPKSTYKGPEVASAHEFVERIRLASDARVAKKARVARIFRNRGMRETELGSDFSKEPRGRHSKLPRDMGRGVSRQHDYNCRICKPSRSDHAPECRLCTPMTAYGQGGHRLHPEIMNYLPLMMKYVNNAHQTNYRYNSPQRPFDDTWRRMKIDRHEKAAAPRNVMSTGRPSRVI